MEQGLLFDFPQFKITKKIRLIELFGGIGSQAMALRDIGADFEHYKLIEFDKYAVQSYNAIHNTQHTTHDIRQTHAKDLEITDKDKYCYLMTYSFPCTDLSVAGKMQGMSKTDWQNGNATRSGLLWEVERILKECDELPQVLLMENVPQVHAEQNRADFESWLNFLRGKGYHNFYKDLNARDFEIPQNRERCFMVSILSDEFIEYDFPEGVKLEKVMKDFLEEQVDEKYYINSEKADKLIMRLIESGVLPAGCHGYANPHILTKVNGFYEQAIETAKKGNAKPGDIIDAFNGKVLKDGISPTITTRPEGKKTAILPCVEIKQATKDGAIKCKVGGCYDASYPDSKTRRGRVQNDGDVTPTITAQGGENINYVETEYRIRKLTPRECWRLMGYTDEDFEKAHNAGVSNSQLYKQAGNAIVKQVLMAIFSQML